MPEEGDSGFLVGSDGGFSEGWRDSLPEDIRGSEAFEGINNFGELASGFAQLKTAPPKDPDGFIDDEGNFTEKWNEVLANEFEDNPSLKQLSNVKTLAKGYVNQGKIVGRKTFDYETATDEEKDELFTKMGVPAEAKEYDFQKPGNMPEDMPYNEEEAQAFMNKAHELKIPKQTATELRNWFNDMQFEGWNNAQTSLDELQSASQKEIKTEYGAAYDDKIALAKRTVNTFGAADALNQFGLEDNPELVRMFVKIGEAMSEDRLIGDGSIKTNALTPEEAKKELNTLWAEKEDALLNPDHPQHKDVVARKGELSRMAHGNK